MCYWCNSDITSTSFAQLVQQEDRILQCFYEGRILQCFYNFKFPERERDRQIQSAPCLYEDEMVGDQPWNFLLIMLTWHPPVNFSVPGEYFFICLLNKSAPGSSWVSYWGWNPNPPVRRANVPAQVPGWPGGVAKMPSGTSAALLGMGRDGTVQCTVMPWLPHTTMGRGLSWLGLCPQAHLLAQLITNSY